MRIEKDFNSDWLFYKGEEFAEASWESVVLPHTWNALDGQDGGGDYYQGVGWYRKTFAVDRTYKEVYISFGAASKMAEVWCNDEFVGQHRGGFSSFVFNLTSFLKEGENEIKVKVNNSNDLPVYPRSADFTFFGGLYRGAKLICFDTVSHFDVESFGVNGLFIKPDAAGKVEADIYVTGGNSLQAVICDADGKEMDSQAVQIKEPGKVSVSLKVSESHLWKGTEDPYFYTMTVRLDDGDEISDHFGFRFFEVTSDKGFFLNGNSYPLHGVCRHQDRENLGWALSEKEHLEDMGLIREIGANTIRLAHYQQAPFFYDLCDKAGMIVWAEIPFISVYDDRPEADENLVSQMTELIMQNYNHPSICFWGVANEIGIAGECDKMYDMVRELNDLTKALDSSRLTVIANVGMTQTSSPLFHITDIASYNIYKGWYEGTCEDHGPFCDEKHGEIPDVPLAISEYGGDCILKWHSEDPKVKDYTEEYQAVLHEKVYQSMEERPYIYATWLWNMFDFAADGRDEGGCKGRNNKGLVTFDRKVKKQAFYFYKACWSKEKFVYICGKRFVKHAAETIDVKVYSNENRVTLFLNDKAVDTLEGNRVFVFKNVKLSDGENQLRAESDNGCMDELSFEKVGEFPKEYVFVEEKNLSANVTQWFASLQKESTKEISRELVQKEGFLSVFDPLEEVYRYREGFETIQELVAKPMSLVDPKMASRMDTGGPMSFHSIWHHISKMFPDELIYMVNDRLSEIRKE